jgi:peptidoglycan/LPS O-acetylase OafA/YrhL
MISRNNVNNFDLVRNVLAFLVFFTHWNILTDSNIDFFIFKLSGVSIDVFFIVSGFLIWWSYNADKNVKNFYLKRFFRIFPLYFVLIVLQSLFFLIYSEGECEGVIRYFVANLFFLNFLAPTVGEVFASLPVDAINGSLWTLKNEVAFYIIVPFIYKLYQRFGKRFLLFLYFSSMVYVFYFFLADNDKMLIQFPGQLRLFLAGIFSYILFQRICKYNSAMLSFLFVCLIIFFRDDALFRFTIYPFLLSFVLIYVVYFVKAVVVKFDFSYSFYIVHFPLIQLSIILGVNPSNQILSFLLLFSLTIIISYFSEIYIEKHFVKLGKSLIYKGRKGS